MIRVLASCLAVCICSATWGQTVQQLEYIESTSPLPGGGVVTSVFFPDQATSTNSTKAIDEASARLAQHSVLQQAMPPVATPSQQPFPVIQTNANSASAVSGQIPSLGVPTRWNTALRPVPGCRTCTVPNATAARPLNLTGLTTAAAAVPPALPQARLSQPQQPTNATTAPVTTAQYAPLIQVRSMPPNVYAGQGIVGSPKLYVDGQPVRNLLRYLIIP